MQNLNDILKNYGDYHQQKITRLTHCVGVPLVTFSIMMLFSWVQISIRSWFSISLLWISLFALGIYYLRLSWRLGGGVMIVLIFFGFIAQSLNTHCPDKLNLWLFLSCFIIGWIFQLVGHFFEQRKPALADNFGQVFAAPLFIGKEIADWIGTHLQK